MNLRSTSLPLIILEEKLQRPRKQTGRSAKVCPLSTVSHPICCSSHHSGILELTHNHGTETLDKTPFHSGNSEPRGFGHIAITVDDVEVACARFERLGVPFQKRLTDGKMNKIAFILDPDGYWIEVVRLSVTFRVCRWLNWQCTLLSFCSAPNRSTILIPHRLREKNEEK